MHGKPAARLTDPTECSLPGHGTNPITSGSSNVLINGLPAAREGDTTECGGALINGLSSSVLINGKLAAIAGSVASHGNVIIGGSGTVIIGNTHTPALFEPPSPSVFPARSIGSLRSRQPAENPWKGSRIKSSRRAELKRLAR